MSSKDTQFNIGCLLMTYTTVAHFWILGKFLIKGGLHDGCIFDFFDIVVTALLKAIRNLYILMVWEPLFVYPEEHAVLEVFPKSSPPPGIHTPIITEWLIERSMSRCLRLFFLITILLAKFNFVSCWRWLLYSRTPHIVTVTGLDFYSGSHNDNSNFWIV